MSHLETLSLEFKIIDCLLQTGKVAPLCGSGGVCVWGGGGGLAVRRPFIHVPLSEY